MVVQQARRSRSDEAVGARTTARVTPPTPRVSWAITKFKRHNTDNTALCPINKPFFRPVFSQAP